jgi:hypothetical protein
MSDQACRIRSVLFAVLLAVVGLAVFSTDASARWNTVRRGVSGRMRMGRTSAIQTRRRQQ